MQTIVRNRNIYLLLSVLVIGSVLVWWFFLRLPPESADTFTGEYELVLTDYDGNKVELSDFKRELTVVNTWASWCPYCGLELQNLQRLKERYGDTVQVIAVNRAEPFDDAKHFMNSWGIDRTKVILLQDSDDAFFKSIEGYAMPETIFVNTRGEIIHHQRGPISMEDTARYIDSLLGKTE